MTQLIRFSFRKPNKYFTPLQTFANLLLTLTNTNYFLISAAPSAGYFAEFYLFEEEAAFQCIFFVSTFIKTTKLPLVLKHRHSFLKCFIWHK